jgi:uncharacterized protein YxjI
MSIEGGRMKRFIISEKMFSLGDDFHIYDENKSPLYFVDGQAFSWGDKLSFKDMNGNELAFISQKLLSLKPRYEIYREGKLFAEISKEFSWLNQKFTLDVPGPNDYSINGSFWKHDYSFTRGGKTVATVSKYNWNWTDTYGIEIADGEDVISILCSAIVIDQLIIDEDD